MEIWIKIYIYEEKQSDNKLDESDSDNSDEEHEDDETTTAEEMKDFQDYVKKQAENQVRKYNEGKEAMPEDEYLSKIDSLNSQQRRIFNDFCERIADPEDEQPFHLYIGGEAGTGKSFLMNLMIEATNRLPNYSGQTLDKPKCLVMAPTGVAAYLVKGATVESALGIQPQKRKTFTPGNASRTSNLRFINEDLKVIFLDEVSMIGNSKFTVMNYRLQKIMGNNQFMGGISVVCTGDFGQLPPVGESMIWENSNMDGRVDIAPNHWDENLKIYHLTEKMRSRDEQFSKISDKVRKGICDAEVADFMKSRVRACPSEENNEQYAKGKLSIIVQINSERDRINREKLSTLLPNEKEYFVSSKDQSTNVKNAPKTFEKLPLTQTGQLENRFIFKKLCPVQVSTNHPQQRYKNNGFVNGVRGYVDSIQVSRDNPDEPEVIWVRFSDDNVGKLLRDDNRALLKFHKPNDPLAVPIRKQKKQFHMKGNINWLREQFPLTVCYAVTAHKSQGQTLDEVLIDFSADSKRNVSGINVQCLTKLANHFHIFHIFQDLSTLLCPEFGVERTFTCETLSQSTYQQTGQLR